MRIKDRHKHVDNNGMVYLPYLNQWNASNSQLAELVTVMSSIFSAEPPVFKVIDKQQSAQSVQSTPHHSHPQHSLPPTNYNQQQAYASQPYLQSQSQPQSKDRKSTRLNSSH